MQAIKVNETEWTVTDDDGTVFTVIMPAGASAEHAMFTLVESQTPQPSTGTIRTVRKVDVVYRMTPDDRMRYANAWNGPDLDLKNAMLFDALGPEFHVTDTVMAGFVAVWGETRANELLGIQK